MLSLQRTLKVTMYASLLLIDLLLFRNSWFFGALLFMVIAADAGLNAVIFIENEKKRKLLASITEKATKPDA